MKRKEFIKGFGLAGLSVTSLALLRSCSTDSDTYLLEEEDSSSDSDTSSDSTDSSSNNTTDSSSDSSSDTSSSSETIDDCEVTPSETEGPYPTHNPQDYERVDIVGDRTGIDLDLNITIRNVNDSCNVLEGAIVDVWHCDKDGNYSEYSGYTSNHFLRGRQESDSSGLVEFATIFPGWYNGRSTHIHVHVFNSDGDSLLVTQIAFPEGENSAVVRVNAATEYGYTKGMSGYTYNAQDNVFSDGVDEELASVSGSVSEGFTLTHDIYVNA